ncbi:pyrroline-5-carboxylate reductase [Bryocella elongata]|uniref:Pyrroline-5-carboxylate reductase n=1 Tax=Bryocella elongata TaxID=863522 RepID=A0A1H5UR36_9BACT|nr:pyrroline-5-carboxylate reductase [Bryocella elongata]SEF76687.1 pyrroline-5-carboxylate reductase [Bryocella elongata]
MTTLPKIGILGVGSIAEALTDGLCAFDDRRAQILLSPRNHVIANRLALRYPNVSVATDNQAVIDGSEIVVLAVRPQVTELVLRELRFRKNQHILSLIATFSVEQLSPLVAPATEISRAVPLPPIAERQGPLALYTRSEAIAQLLDGLGVLIRLENEAHLDLISAVTSLMGTYFGMMSAVDDWLIDGGFQPKASRAFVAELFSNLARASKTHPEESFTSLSRDYSTPGGLNEQAWRELRAAGWGNQIQAALDLILDRIHGHATLDTQLPRRREAGS